MRRTSLDRICAGTATGVVFLALLFSFWPAADAVCAPRVLGSGTADELPHLQVTSRTPDGMRIEFTLPTLTVEEIQAQGQDFQSVAIPGGGDRGDLGAPILPTFGRFVLLPDRAGVTVSAIVEEEEEVGGYRLVPMQDEGTTTFAYDAAAYARVGYGDDPVVQVGEPALLRGLRVAALTVSPVRYDPSRGLLKIARRMTVQVTYAGQDLRNTPNGSTPLLTPSFDRIYRAMVLGYDGPGKAQGLQHGTYLVICPNDAAVVSRLAPLLDWRRRMGFPVKLATTAETGSSTTAIKAYLQNAYDNWAVPPEYVVLAADAQSPYSLPTFTENLSGYSGEGDHPYTQLAGGDILSDVHLGRLSFSTTAELETIVAKTVGYEKTPFMDDTSWYGRACLVGDPTSSSGYSTVMTMQWIKTRLLQLGYTDVDTVFSGNFVTQMAADLNQGDTFFAYRGYVGMSGWQNSNTSALTNGWKLSFACMSTCGTGSFAGSTARSEAFLRVGSATTPKGAVGAIGTATTGTHTRFNNCYTFGVFWGMLYSDTQEMGSAHTWGKLNLYLNYNATQSNWVTIFSYWNNLMGDPACDIFTAVPAALSVNHPATLSVGANAFAATVTGGQPVPGAVVCLYRTITGGEIQVTGTTDELGRCELAIPPAEAGTFQLTVTDHNRLPYLADVPVTTQNTFIAYQASSIDDDNSGESLGDGSGTANPGETIELPVQLKNFGTVSGSNVTAVITTDDPFATITDDSESYGTIAGGASAWCADDFGFTVRGDCPHGHVLRFGLDASSGAATWHSLVEVPVVSADAQYVSHVVGNAGPGGIFDPGETVTLAVTLRNDGGIAAAAPSATLLSRSEYLDIPDGGAAYPDMSPGASQSNSADPFTVHASADCPRGQETALRLVLNFNGSMSDTVDFVITVGTRTNADPIGPDGYGYYAYDDTDAGYPERPTYNWIEIDPNLGGTGTQVTLGDYSDYQDKSRTVTMPFSFSYYGQSYPTATICSNGWVVMGSTYLTDYRNWTIPSPGGPNGVIAAYWDDLIEVTSPAGHVYQWYDAANHLWVVEWSRMKNIINSSTQTVQAVFYDPAFYSTETGDGMILFQYKTVSNPDGTDGYATIGIEKPDNADGLLYTYFNRYPIGAPTIAANRAILFVPKEETLSGIVGGTVRNASSADAPLSGATVTVLQSGHQYVSGADGTYLGSELPGVYTMTATRTGFAPDTVSAVVVTTGGTTTTDFFLADIAPPLASVVLAAPSTPDTLGTHPVRIAAQDMSVLPAVTVHYRQFDGAFETVAMAEDGAGFYRGEIPAQHWTTRIDYYVSVTDGGGNTTLLPAGAPDDVLHFWVGPLVTLWQDDLESENGWSVGSFEDNATSGVWERVDPNGTFFFGEPVQPEDDHTTDPGTNCWVTGNAPAGADQDAADVDGGVTTLVSPRLSCPTEGAVFLRYWRWYTNNTGGLPDDMWLVQVSNDDGTSWKDLERTGTTDRSWQLKEFDLGTILPLTNLMRVRFLASDNGLPSIVEAAVDDIEIAAIGLDPTSAPEPAPVSFGFAAGSANPIRPGGKVLFSLTRPATVSLDVFDIQGRCVRHLLSDALPAGSHAVAWDGNDDRGRALPAGLYFQRLTAGRESETRKTLMLR